LEDSFSKTSEWNDRSLCEFAKKLPEMKSKHRQEKIVGAFSMTTDQIPNTQSLAQRLLSEKNKIDLCLYGSNGPTSARIAPLIARSARTISNFLESLMIFASVSIALFQCNLIDRILSILPRKCHLRLFVRNKLKCLHTNR
jgi:hypothetical protein